MELRTKLGEGGEGAVWVSPVASNFAIKTYLKAMPSAQVDKLTAMTKIADASLLAAAAWPTRLVYDVNRCPVGFEMPKLSGQKPLHDLIGTKSRIKAFPNSNWQMLVHAAQNLALAFQGLHAKNIVVGDVNSNNVVIQDDARVLFIDCDSFQIKTPGHTFRCEVGVPDYQPPELQNTPFGTVDRLPSHDAFGMAVMIFQLLFVGKHPFMGRLLNPGAGGQSPGENISSGHYFYDARARQLGMSPPPASLSLGAVTPAVSNLFERAFRGRPQDRPTASEWSQALGELERTIVPCKADSAHRHMGGISCPWCSIELQSQIVYFSAPILLTSNGEIDDSVWATFPNAEADRLWREIAAFAQPIVAYETTPKAQVVPAAIGIRLQRKGELFIGVIASLIVAAIVIVSLPALRNFEVWDIVGTLAVFIYGRPSGGSELAGRKQRLVAAKVEFDRADTEWKALCDGQALSEQRTRLKTTHDAVIVQRSKYDAEIADVKRTGEQQAKKLFLDSHFIRDAKIKGIGPSLTARLEAWNIETALDIDQRVQSVSGIGAQKADALFNWRQSVERQFRFQPNMIDGLLRDVTSRHVLQRKLARNALTSGSRSLSDLRDRLTSKAPAVRERVAEARRALDQYEADARAFNPFVYR